MIQVFIKNSHTNIRYNNSFHELIVQKKKDQFNVTNIFANWIYKSNESYNLKRERELFLLFYNTFSKFFTVLIFKKLRFSFFPLQAVHIL